MKGLARVGVSVLVLGAVIIGLLVADSWSRSEAQRRVSEMVAARVDGGSVTTQIGGWPFLLGRLANRMDAVEVTITDATFTLGQVSGAVDQVSVLARGVSPIDDPTAAVAETLDASVSLSWQPLSDLLGLPIEWVGGDRISVSSSVEVFGVAVDIVVAADLSVRPDGTLALAQPSVTAAGIELPAEVVQAALDRLAPRLKLPIVPGLDYTGLECSSTGVAVRLSGERVSLSALG